MAAWRWAIVAGYALGAGVASRGGTSATEFVALAAVGAVFFVAVVTMGWINKAERRQW